KQASISTLHVIPRKAPPCDGLRQVCRLRPDDVSSPKPGKGARTRKYNRLQSRQPQGDTMAQVECCEVLQGRHAASKVSSSRLLAREGGLINLRWRLGSTRRWAQFQQPQTA